jgi:hypothetical protein
MLPRGRNFGGKNTKGVEKILWGHENLGPNVSDILKKRPKMARNFL